MAISAQYDYQTLSAIWAKAQIVPNNNPSVFRKDTYGYWIKWNDYGTTSKYGWEVDHIIPVSRRGSDVLGNLQPLHWENNRRKSDNLW